MSSDAAAPRGPATRRGIFAKATPSLLFFCFILAIGETVFGYDVSSFGGVQAIPAFETQFGHCVAGKCAIPTYLSSIMNSFSFIGKFIGTLSAGPVIERFGHRYALLAMVIINYIGALIEITAKVPAQFIVGRIIVYVAVGYVEVAVPTYQAELVPASMRGFVVSSLQFFLVAGGLIASGVNKAFSTGTTSAAWQVPVGLTFVFPTIVLVSLPFIPDAPRWLLFKGRREAAVKTLRRVRPRADVDAGLCELEVDAIEAALHQQREKMPWTDLVRGTNLRRTTIACVTFTMAQFTGQAFTSQYSVVFYQAVGLGTKSFTYPIITSALSLIAVAFGMYALDRFGRRPVYIVGGLAQAFWIFLVAGLGGKAKPTSSDINGLVAASMLYALSFSFSWAPAPYITASEIATGGLREKTMAVSATFNVVAAWLVSFTLPYLLNQPYAGLGPKVGYIYGSLCCLCSLYAILFIPETKGRSLEELDELFDMKISAWRFASTPTTGAGHRVAVIENEEKAAFFADADEVSHNEQPA